MGSAMLPPPTAHSRRGNGRTRAVGVAALVMVPLLAAAAIVPYSIEHSRRSSDSQQLGIEKRALEAKAAGLETLSTDLDKQVKERDRTITDLQTLASGASGAASTASARAKALSALFPIDAAKMAAADIDGTYAATLTTKSCNLSSCSDYGGSQTLTIRGTTAFLPAFPLTVLSPYLGGWVGGTESPRFTCGGAPFTAKVSAVLRAASTLPNSAGDRLLAGALSGTIQWRGQGSTCSPLVIDVEFTATRTS